MRRRRNSNPDLQGSGLVGYPVAPRRRGTTTNGEVAIPASCAAHTAVTLGREGSIPITRAPHRGYEKMRHQLPPLEQGAVAEVPQEERRQGDLPTLRAVHGNPGADGPGDVPQARKPDPRLRIDRENPG